MGHTHILYTYYLPSGRITPWNSLGFRPKHPLWLFTSREGCTAARRLPPRLDLDQTHIFGWELTLGLRAMGWCRGGVRQVALSLQQISKISLRDFIILALSV